MKGERIQIRLDEATLQRVEWARRHVPADADGNNRGGLPSSSTVLRCALNAYLDALEKIERKRRTKRSDSAPFTYEAETGKLFWARAKPKINIGDEAGWIERRRHTIYRRVCLNGEKLYVHRIVWEMHYGHIPAGLEIDHEDGNGLNNRLENLRLVTDLVNNQNARKSVKNTSGFSGVSWDKRSGQWRAYAKTANQQIHLGYFAVLEHAAEAARSQRDRIGYHPNHGTDRTAQ